MCVPVFVCVRVMGVVQERLWQTSELPGYGLQICMAEMVIYCAWLVLCVNLTQAGVITEKGASGEEMTPGDPTVRHFLN